MGESNTATPLSKSHIGRRHLLQRSVAEIVVEQELEERLESGRPLRLKQGFDPTRPALHLGHAVGLLKLRQFQELGHRVVLIVGDWTAQIGDPSEQARTRRMLSAEEVRSNAQAYMDQFFRVVDRSKTEVRWQSDWFGKFSLSDVIDLASRFTVAQILAREDFSRRFNAGNPVAITELLYPLLQAYDSVAIDADVEFGGTDQKFNILTGRELQRMLGREPQEVFLVKMIPGTDGANMSQSRGNYIPLLALPHDMYGKLMSLHDDVMPIYFECLTAVPEEEVHHLLEDIRGGRVNPRDVKALLAREIVAQFHGLEAALKAEEEFERVFRRREAPTQVPERYLPAATDSLSPVDLLVAVGFAASKSEARRLVQQGAVEIDGSRVRDPRAPVRVEDGATLKCGPFRRIRLRLGPK